MKNLYQVVVKEVYCKIVDVVAGSQDEAHEEVRTMVENGEVIFEGDDWDSEDFEVTGSTICNPPPEERQKVITWCSAVINTLSLTNPKSIWDIGADEACEMLERFRDEGLEVPLYADSTDLLAAACVWRTNHPDK